MSFAEFGENAGYVEELFELYRANPDLVSQSWAAYFSARRLPEAPAGQLRPGDSLLQERATTLIRNFRRSGHLIARISPLSRGVPPRTVPEDLRLEHYRFSAEELETEVACDGLAGKGHMTLREIINQLERIYCGSVGFDFDYITNSSERLWLRSRIEREFAARLWFDTEQKRRFVFRLVEAELFDSELHLKYVGSKRFSLRGGETLSPMLDYLLDRAADAGLAEAVLGMSHRGRINVISNLASKPLSQVVAEFEDRDLCSELGWGDVKYHLGYSSIFKTFHGKELRFTVASNPSHLEYVDPVVCGMVRARQDLRFNRDSGKALAILIHGDAALSGQGVVYETLNFSRQPGYSVGGTLHCVVNNQIGFTTDAHEGRSSTYCTDVARAIEAPVFHVNSEDVEACCWASALALEYRNRFKKDVFIDLYCYRLFGHNEGDDPSFTQPLMYSEIRSRKSLAQMYSTNLIEDGVLAEAEVKKIEEDMVDYLRAEMGKPSQGPGGEMCPVYGRLRDEPPRTAPSKDQLDAVAEALVDYPKGFTVHPKLKGILERRANAVLRGAPIEWGLAEALAFGSLVLDGRSVRLSGQDSGRGTFSQRHLELHDYSKTGRFCPLAQLAEKSGSGIRFEVYNSILSESGVLGFEFGYSAEAPGSLVLWEAQFGDFSNAAQPIIDQFIASSEAKWDQRAGVVLLLPHGYEGQGPEHSSARLERFLQICAMGNITVCYPSTAAQYFHLLRRQGLMQIKRPLVIMTPKSLLRLPQASSQIGEFLHGTFEPVLRSDFGTPRLLVLCSGKIYYDLQKAFSGTHGVNATVLRLEQLYPFPRPALAAAFGGTTPRQVVWVQEEPANMGAFRHLRLAIEDIFGSVRYIGRPESSSTATGSFKRHQREQAAIVEETLRLAI